MSAAQQIDRLVAGAQTLASFPAIFHEINEVIERPGSSAADIGRVLSKDSGLAARLLRIANSAFYSFPSRVDTIAQALVIVGTRQLRDLVIGTIAVSQFRGLDPKLIDMPTVWRHGLACGCIARAIAQRRREPNTERLFIAGLLHDVGSLLIYQQLPKAAGDILAVHQETRRPLEEVERTALGFDHTQAGAALMTAWKLPIPIRQAAAEHHRPKVGSPNGVDAGTVHVADVLAHALELGSNGERMVPKLDPAAWEALGLPTSSLEEIVDEVLAGLASIEGLFLGDMPR